MKISIYVYNNLHQIHNDTFHFTVNKFTYYHPYTTLNLLFLQSLYKVISILRKLN